MRLCAKWASHPKRERPRDCDFVGGTTTWKEKEAAAADPASPRGTQHTNPPPVPTRQDCLDTSVQAAPLLHRPLIAFDLGACPFRSVNNDNNPNPPREWPAAEHSWATAASVGYAEAGGRAPSLRPEDRSEEDLASL